MFLIMNILKEKKLSLFTVTFTMKFDKIGDEMPIINNLTAVFTNHIGKRYEDFILKNIPVD